MLTAFIAIFIQGVGAYFLAQKFNPWIALLPLALALALVSSIASNMVTFFVAQGFIESEKSNALSVFYLIRTLKDLLGNTFWCILFVWAFRRQKLKSVEKKSVL